MTDERLRELLTPYAPGVEMPVEVISRFQQYLEVLLRWNLRTNLTAVREPEEVVRRHFGESVFAGAKLVACAGGMAEVLDVGSGAGFPGLPMQIVWPGLKMTLAESQGKKAAFLREAVRVTAVGAEVWGGRVEEMEVGRRFGAVVMRAVDRMEEMVGVARERVRPGGVLLGVGTESFAAGESWTIPGSREGRVWVERVGGGVEGEEGSTWNGEG